jgi:hypothetical protein
MNRKFYGPQDLRDLGIQYCWGHIKRLARQGKIPPLHQRAPGCKCSLGEEHIAALTGRRDEVAS